MSIGRPLTTLICWLITSVAWLSAVAQGATAAALASAVIITALCGAIVFLRLPSRSGGHSEIPLRQKPRGELIEFRRELFDLCAALRLGVDFCERHLNSRPELLIGELESMTDSVRVFINKITRPVRFYARGGCSADRLPPWPPEDERRETPLARTSPGR